MLSNIGFHPIFLYDGYLKVSFVNPNSNLDHLSKQPTVTLVRHGETESNRLIHNSRDQQVNTSTSMIVDTTIDTHLTGFGHLQAQFTADHLIDTYRRLGARKLVLLVSPFDRVMNTAKPFLDANNIPLTIQIEPLLQEAFKSDKIIPYNLAVHGIRHLDWTQYMENIHQLHDKIKTILASLQEGEHLIVFGHSLTFSLLISSMFGSDKVILQSPNCSITTARMGKSTGINSTGINLPWVKESPGVNSTGINLPWEILHAASIAHLPPWLVSGIHTLTGIPI